MFVLNSLVTNIVRIDHFYIVLIEMVATSTHKLNTNRNSGCKTRIIQVVSNRNTNIAIIVVHHEEFNVNTCKIDKFYSITNKPNNYDTIIIVINMVDIITHQVGYISHFTMDCFNDIRNSSGTAAYFIVSDYNVFKFGSRMNTTNTVKIFKKLQFIIVRYC